MPNKNLVARLIECWNTGKLDDIDALLSPDFIRHEPEWAVELPGRKITSER
jgi:hypothetical protein